jgi:hypothetical protein
MNRIDLYSNKTRKSSKKLIEWGREVQNIGKHNTKINKNLQKSFIKIKIELLDLALW